MGVEVSTAPQGVDRSARAERLASTASARHEADAAVGALFRAESARLVSMLWAVTGDRRQAEDLTQEAFVRLYEHWHRLEDAERAVGWRRVTALNLARSGFRHLAVVRRRPPHAVRDVPSVEDDAVLDDDRRHLVAAVRQLPARQRECVVLRFFGEMSESAIAEATGLSHNTVKTHLRRGLGALERTMEDRR